MKELRRDDDVLLVEAVDMGDVDALEEDVLPSSFLCTGCGCTC